MDMNHLGYTLVICMLLSLAVVGPENRLLILQLNQISKGQNQK